MKRLAAAAFGFAMTSATAAMPPSAEDYLTALARGRCEASFDELNKGLKEGDAAAYFVVGFMHLKGLCVASAPAQAVPYLELAGKAGVADAARNLVMIHGLGLGVPQSYSQAGRWTVAWIDIFAASRGAKLFTDAAASQPGQLSQGTAEAYGVLGTVAAALEDRIRYPRGSSARLPAGDAQMTLALHLAPEGGLRYDISDVRVGIEAGGGNSILRRSADPHVEEIKNVIKGILDELPAQPAASRLYTVRIPFRFRITY